MTMTTRRFATLLVLLLAALLNSTVLAEPVTSDPAPLRYRSAAEEARFHALTAELRCVQCQNQSLADSHAQIAHDLRREVLDLMHQGRSDDQIKQFLVARYGEFVLYRPRLERATWLLWFGPGVLLLAGIGLVVWLLRRQRTVPPVDDEPQEW